MNTVVSNKKPRLTFADYQTFGDPSLERAKQLAQKFVEDVLKDPFGRGYVLTLAGKSGTGKTMLLKIILDELRLNGWGFSSRIKPVIQRGKLLDFSIKLFDLRKVSDQFKEFDYSAVEAMISKTLAALDDIGADYDPKKITASKIDRVLRERRGWTLCTVNLPLHEIADKLDTRIASFLIRDENKFHEVESVDYAMREKFAA